MTPSIGHVILLFFLASSSSSPPPLVSSLLASCPHGCTCKPDHEVHDVIGAMRLMCSRRTDVSNLLEKQPEGVNGNVTHLDLSDDELTIIRKDYGFFKFQFIRYLNLSNNKIKSIERGALGQLKFLKFLDLSNNRLTLLDHGLFSDGTDLEASGKFGGEEETLNDGNLWRRMTYDDSGDEDEREKALIYGFPRLKTSLIELDLSRNDLRGIDGVFDGMESLTKLNLNENKLQNISSITFRNLVNLRWLSLNSNKLQSINSEAFVGVEKLTNLMMKNNPSLQRLERLDLRKCSHLNYLDISECGLTDVPRGLSESLRYLQLRRNHLTKISSDSFKECTGLNILLLDGNKISTIEDDAVKNIINLQQLWLNENLLMKAPRRLPKSLQRLLLDSNRLTEWPSGVFGSGRNTTPSLTILSLSGNHLSDINSETFGELTRLTSLDLSDNRIHSLPSKAFSGNNVLESLNLNKNPLKQFHVDCFEGVPSLKHLFLSFINTPLDNLKISRNFMKPLQENLKTLEIDHSPSLARALIVGSHGEPEDDDFRLSSMDRLFELSATGLDLTTINKDDLNNFLPNNLKVLRFTSTRWHCDRSLTWFQEWLTEGSSGLQTASSNLCYTPRSIHGKPLMSLAAKDFVAITTTLAPPNKSSKSTFQVIKSTQTIAKTRNSSTSRQGSKTSKQLQLDNSQELLKKTIEDEFTDVELLNPPKNNEDSLIIHVTDFIKKAIIEDFHVDVEKNAIDENTKNGTYRTDEKESETLPDESLSVEIPNEQTDPRDSFETFFKQYFTNNDDVAIENSRPPSSNDNNTHDHGDVKVDGVADTQERNNFIVTIAIVIIVVTAIIASFIIFLIVLTCRKKKKPSKETIVCSSKDSLADSNKTIIKYKNKDGILYFSTSSMTGIDSESTDVNGSASTARQSLADRRLNEYRSSPTLSETKNASNVRSGNNNNSNNCIHNNNFNNNKTLSYRWEDT